MSDWKRQGERGSPALIRLIRWIALHLGRPPARLLLYPISAYFLLTASSGRRASREYLRRALGREPTLRDQFRHLHAFAATILDRVYLIAGQHQRFEVHGSGHHLADDLIRDGRGALLFGAHLGSFEILRTLAIKKGRFRIKVLMHRDHNPVITQLLDSLNPEVAESVIPLGTPNSALLAKEWLDGGGFVGMLADRVAGGKVIRCEFFGEPTCFPAGPLQLARALQVPVLMFFGLYRGGNRYDLHIEKLCDAPAPGADLAPIAQRYAERLEHHARQAPYNWFNFYDFWNDHSH